MRLAAEMRVAAAVKWYEMEMLSQGKAAEAAGLSRAAFMEALCRFKVSSCQETTEEILISVTSMHTWVQLCALSIYGSVGSKSGPPVR